MAEPVWTCQDIISMVRGKFVLDRIIIMDIMYTMHMTEIKAIQAVA
jgi:hypothetical protein